LRIDDPLDAVAVHACGGLWGVLIAPVLMRTGIVYGGGASTFIRLIAPRRAGHDGEMGDALLQLLWNVIGAVAIVVWTVLTAGPMFFALKACNILRVSKDVEIKGEARQYPFSIKHSPGLDIYKHGEPAYPLVAYGHGWGEDEESKARVRKMSRQNGAVHQSACFID